MNNPYDQYGFKGLLNPTDEAIGITRTLIESRDYITTHPDPEFWWPTTADAYARRIIAHLLNAGWTPPE